MNVRLRDWAELNRISERTVQIRIKEHWDELQEHVERRGKQGTWLDDFAQEFLLERIQLPKEEEVFIPSAREAALMFQLNEANQKLAEAERDARLNAEAAGKVLYLEAATQQQTAQIDSLTRENAVLSLDIAEKDKTLAELKGTAHELSQELSSLTERNKITENNLKTVQDRLKVIESKWWYKLFAGKNKG